MDTLPVKGRARKPNFTNEEIDILLQHVTSNRDVLLSNDNKADCIRNKQVIWQQIAADVTLNSDRLCQRDPFDVRQKWKDLLRAANKELRAVEAAREKNESIPSISPYSNRVIRIKTGKPIFNDSTDDGDDVHSAGSSFFDALALKHEPVNGVASTSGWNHVNDKVQPSFTNKEIRCLITEFDKNKTILKADADDATTKTQQCDIWKVIARTISEKGPDRTASECQKKWLKFLHQARKEEQMENEEDEKGCSFSKSHFTNLIVRVNRTEEEVVESAELGDEFWDSLEDNTADVDDDSIEFTFLVNDDKPADNVCDVKIKTEPEDDSTCTIGNEDTSMDSLNQNGDIETQESTSTPLPTSVHRSPLKRTLSPKALNIRPDLFSRKRKRPHSSLYGGSRLNVFHHRTAAVHNPGSNSPRSYYKERQELESRRLQLEVEKLELENSIMRTQREKMELEKEKLRMEMEKIAEEKHKVDKLELENSLMRTQREKMELEKEKLRMEMEKIAEEKHKVSTDRQLVEMNIRVLSQKLHNGDS